MIQCVLRENAADFCSSGSHRVRTISEDRLSGAKRMSKRASFSLARVSRVERPPHDELIFNRQTAASPPVDFRPDTAPLAINTPHREIFEGRGVLNLPCREEPRCSRKNIGHVLKRRTLHRNPDNHGHRKPGRIPPGPGATSPFHHQPITPCQGPQRCRFALAGPTFSDRASNFFFTSPWR